MTNKVFFYGRISSQTQSIDRQLATAKELGIDERDIYIDTASGKNFEREQYQLLKRNMRQNDLLYLSSLDRLGRSYSEVVEQYHELINDIGIDIVVLDMPLLDTRNTDGGLTRKFISDLVLQVLSYVAEQERLNIRERQRQGIEIAKANGKFKGRKRIDRENFAEVYSTWKTGDITAKQAMNILNLKPNTFYRRVKAFETAS
ncbi:MAG: recombinase family protein [Clostridia bacterium]|nr:recombinase family protein [Clostridia bacterium]